MFYTYEELRWIVQRNTEHFCQDRNIELHCSHLLLLHFLLVADLPQAEEEYEEQEEAWSMEHEEPEQGSGGLKCGNV